MIIELTTEQSQAIAAEGDPIVLVDPRTKQAYRLVKQEAFEKVQNLYDSSPWSPGEMAYLADMAFSKLDHTDYSEYLRFSPL
jgi:hypothetical protein